MSCITFDPPFDTMKTTTNPITTLLQCKESLYIMENNNNPVDGRRQMKLSGPICTKSIIDQKIPTVFAKPLPKYESKTNLKPIMKQ